MAGIGSWRSDSLLALVLLLGAGWTAFSGSALAQSADGPAEVALKLVAALKSHDNATAATFLVAANRDDFTSLMDASARLDATRKRLGERTAAAFGDENAMVMRGAAKSGPDAVVRADVARQTPIDRDTVELALDLVTSSAATVQHTTWRAVKENGAWKIELPACASPAAAAGLRQRITDMTRIAEDIATKVDSGALRSPVETRAALIAAERPALPPTRQ